METLINNNINKESLTFSEKKIKAKKIINLINNYFQSNCENENKTKSIIIPRQMAMYYIRTYLGLTANETAKLFPSKKAGSGHKHHATVLHAQSTISDLIDVDFEIKAFHKDLDIHCQNIAKLNSSDIENYTIIEDISNNLKQLETNQLKRISQYINHRYLN